MKTKTQKKADKLGIELYNKQKVSLPFNSIKVSDWYNALSEFIDTYGIFETYVEFDSGNEYELYGISLVAKVPISDLELQIQIDKVQVELDRKQKVIEDKERVEFERLKKKYAQ